MLVGFFSTCLDGQAALCGWCRKCRVKRKHSSSVISLFMGSTEHVHSAFLQMSNIEVRAHSTSSRVAGSGATQILTKHSKRPFFWQNSWELEWKTKTESFTYQCISTNETYLFNLLLPAALVWEPDWENIILEWEMMCRIVNSFSLTCLQNTFT